VHALPIVSNCMVIGDRRKYLTCLLTLKSEVDADGLPTDTLDKSVLSEYVTNATAHGLSTVTEAISSTQVKNYIQERINEVNRQSISNAHTVKYFRVLPRDFSVGGGELGPTLKTKRNVVEAMYKELIDEMYALPTV